MKGSYSVPTGSRRTPLMTCDSPSADSRMNKFASAMPSSMCWPLGENSQLKVEGICSLLNVSASASRANSPRRFTQGPRLVETVTSGDAVTMRLANSSSPRPISLRMAPKPVCVDITGCTVTASVSGTAMGGVFCWRSAACARGTPLRNSCRRSGGIGMPSNLSHSWPGRTLLAARNVSICAGVIRPEWLSLWPANGRPKPLMV